VARRWLWAWLSSARHVQETPVATSVDDPQAVLCSQSITGRSPRPTGTSPSVRSRSAGPSVVEGQPLLADQNSRAVRGARRRAGLLALPLIVVLTGCTKEVERGWLPSTPETTNHTDSIISLWNGSWIAALAVGVLVWGLMLWCVFAYRRRRDEVGYPAQVRYNIPLEIMYTIIPVMMIGVLLVFTVQRQSAIADTSAKPDVNINVVGKQWSWDFNYLDAGVYEVGLQGELDGEPGVLEELPTLYLPVNKRVEFTLTARDVIHSFWIPSFLYKMDTVPGVRNRFQVVPQREGFFKGKCAELCGEYHSEMVFNVKVVSQAEYDAHLADLRAQGKVGRLDANLGREDTPPGPGAVPGNKEYVEPLTGGAE
jgi:cytochrome c oxidase subunit 2